MMSMKENVSLMSSPLKPPPGFGRAVGQTVVSTLQESTFAVLRLMWLSRPHRMRQEEWYRGIYSPSLADLYRDRWGTGFIYTGNLSGNCNRGVRAREVQR